MKAIICIKQVPGTTDIKIDPDTNTLVREGIESIINPFDSYAVEEGISLSENSEYISETVAVTMGPPQAEQILRDAICLGIDEAILLSDKQFAGADTWATSVTLAAAAKKIDDAGLVIFGKQTLDGDTGQVGPEFAEKMKMSFIGNVGRILYLDDKVIRAKRLMDNRYETIEAPMPAAVSVTKDINEPRIPSLRGKMKAKKADIPIWDSKILGLKPEKTGLDGSFTQVVKVFIPQRKHEVTMISGTPQEQAQELIKKIKDLNLI